MSIQKITHLAILCCFLHLPFLLLGQYKYKKFTYVGFNLGIKNELYKVIDSGSELYNKSSFQNRMSGFFVEQELNRFITLGSGIYFTNYGVDFRFKSDNGFNVFKSMKTTLLPIKIGVNLPVYYGIPEIRLSPQLGINAVLNRTDKEYPISGKIAPDLSNTYEGKISYNLSKWYFLAEGGLNIDILFAKGLIFTFGSRYCQGFNDVAKVDIGYRIDRAFNIGNLSSKGSFYALHTGIKYPIHKFSKKKSKRK